MSNADGLVPLDDAFLAVVRRRHPDVDIIVLPQEPDVEEPSSGALDPDEVERTTSEILELVVGAARLESMHGDDPRWEYGDTATSVCRLAGSSATAVDAAIALEALEQMTVVLRQSGWTVHVPSGSTPRLAGSRDHYRVDALFAAEMERLSVDVTSPVVEDSDARRRVEQG